MKYLYIALSSIILAYVIIALFTYLYQRKLLYHPSENNYTGDEIQFEYKEVFIEVDKDIKLKSWFLEKDLKKDKTILYFHGNAGDLTNRVHKLNELDKLNVNILIISILISIKNFVSPKLDPASLKPLPTCLIPKFVNRIIGGKANIIVATTPGVRPTPKSITTGIK